MDLSQVKGCVLLVDDETSVRESLGELLTEYGFGVFTADGVDSAIELLERENIEVIISDLKMPGKTGLDLISYLNQRSGRKIPLIVLTGYGTPQTRREAMRNGAMDYINKPIENKDNILLPLERAIEQFWQPFRRAEAKPLDQKL